MDVKVDVVVIISANVEWAVIRQIFTNVKISHSPFGEWFIRELKVADRLDTVLGTLVPVLFIHGGWGKISAAASAQYAIDRWNPSLLINLGTCGGFEGSIHRGDIVLVNRTLVYDIYEQMGDAEDHIAYYSTDVDLTWLGKDIPEEVLCTTLLSADRDLVPEEIPMLKERYRAVVGDWESGAIAWVAKRNNTRCLILRGVSDLVGVGGGEAYEDKQLFIDATDSIMRRLVGELPLWVEKGLTGRGEDYAP